jgi:hypothetical protein
MTRLVDSTNQIQRAGDNILTSSSLVELFIECHFEKTPSHLHMVGVELHAVCKGSDALFPFVEGLFPGFNLQKVASANLAAVRDMGAGAVEVCALDDGCTIAEFAETDFCGDNVFFEDLSPEALVSCSGEIPGMGWLVLRGTV